jgi:predicted MFS family arabinose efflux permease
MDAGEPFYSGWPERTPIPFNTVCHRIIPDVCYISIVLLLITHDPYLLMAFAILFGLVDFATVAPTSMLATPYFKRYSVGVVPGWLYLARQIGSALGAYLPGVW